MKLRHLIGVLLALLLGSGIAKAQEEYDVWICGVEVTSENVNKLDKIEGVTVGAGGYITYSPDSHTLSIKNVSLHSNGRANCLCAYSKYKDLPFTLLLEGENLFDSSILTTFRTEVDASIEGSGKLSIRTSSIGIFAFGNTTLTIKDCTLDIVSKASKDGRAGIDAGWDQQSHLIIKNASIYAKASGADKDPYPYAIGGLESISLEGATITQPNNAGIDSYTFGRNNVLYVKRFVLSGGKPAKEVRIEKNLAVERVNLPDLHLFPNPADRDLRLEGAKAGMTVSVYSLRGEQLLSVTTDQTGVADLDVSHLPAGSYMLAVGGNKLKLVVRH